MLQTVQIYKYKYIHEHTYLYVYLSIYKLRNVTNTREGGNKSSTVGKTVQGYNKDL